LNDRGAATLLLVLGLLSTLGLWAGLAEEPPMPSASGAIRGTAQGALPAELSEPLPGLVDIDSSLPEAPPPDVISRASRRR